MKFFSLNLNSYWIEFMSTISLILTIITFELLAYIILQSLNSLFEATITLDEIKNAFSVIIDDIGLKWYVFIEISQHLSVGFFCLTTFSQILNETQNIKKFYILNCIKLAFYYAGSVIFLKIIKEDFKQLIKYYIDKEREEKKLKIKQELLDKIYEYLDKFIAFIFFYLTDFLSTFNVFLDRLVLGSLYIFLFITPYNCLNKNLIYFRLISIIFVLFIIISIILRALHKAEILILNEFISPILLGPKISIYGFFISTLCIIKYKSMKNQVFDGKNFILSKIFTSIGSIMFAIFGILEMIIGLFLPSWGVAGIGKNYVLILCAPIITLYDYRKEYKMHLCCCKKRNFSILLKIIVYLFGSVLAILLGIALYKIFLQLLKNFIVPLLKAIVNNWDDFGEFVQLLKLLFL